MHTLGTYWVNGRPYVNKLSAILEAQQTMSRVTWDYFGQQFRSVNWLWEPSESLDQLYRQRAQQIRDTYDYVIVLCSGGADSTQAVKSFLLNGLHVDEVVASHPLSGLNGWTWSRDKSVENTISETEYAQRPLLQWIANHYPQVKITSSDYFEQMQQIKAEQWVWSSQDWVNPVIDLKASLDHIPRLVDLAESGQRVAIVWGVEKPLMRCINGQVYTLISDLGVNNIIPSFRQTYNNVDSLAFYWAPDMPKILVKQAHVLARAMVRDPLLWDMIQAYSQTGSKSTEFNQMGAPINTWQGVGDYQRHICPLLYPSTHDPDLFQCVKGLGAFMGPVHDWFYKLHQGTDLYRTVKGDFQDFYRQIKPQYLRANGGGFLWFTNRYDLGPIENFRASIS